MASGDSSFLPGCSVSVTGRTIIGLIVGLALSLGLGWLFLLSGPALECREEQPSWKYHLGALVPGQTAGQTIINRGGDLARVDVRLGTFGWPLAKPVRLDLIPVDDPLPEQRYRPMAAGHGVGWSFRIYRGQPMGQTFVAHRPDLKGIYLLINSTWTPPEAVVTLKLWQDELAVFPGKLLRTVKLKAKDMVQRGFQLFPFEPIVDSAGQRYLFTVEADDIGPGQALRAQFLTERWQYETWPYKRAFSYPDGQCVLPFSEMPPEIYKIATNSWLGDIIFRLAYPPVMPTEPVVRSVSKPGWRITDNDFNAFTFKPIPGSQGKAYYFRLRAEPGWGIAPTPMADPVDRYPYGCLTINGVPSHGSMSFRTYHTAPQEQAWELLGKRIGGNKPGWLGRPKVLLGLVVGQLVLLGLVLGLLLRRRP